MSVLSAVDKKFALTGIPASSEVAELTNRMALTRLQDDNGNNLDLVPGDLSTRGETEDKDSGFASEEGAGYDLADHIDQLTLLSERDIDCRVLEEFGAGDKRARAQSQEGEEEEQEVPTKRTTHPSPPTTTRPPPELASFLRFGANETPVNARRQNGGQRLLASVSGDAANSPGNVVFCRGNLPNQHVADVALQPQINLSDQWNTPSNPGNILSNSAASQHNRVVVSLAGSIGSQSAALRRSATAGSCQSRGNTPSNRNNMNTWSDQSPAGHTDRPGSWSERLLVYPTPPPAWSDPSSPQYTSEHQVSSGSPEGHIDAPSKNSPLALRPSECADLPTDVGTDGASATLEEKNRKIEQIMQHLMNSFPQQKDGALPGSSLPLAGPPFVSRQGPARSTGCPVSAQSPAGWTGSPDLMVSPTQKASSIPAGRRGGTTEFHSRHRTMSAAPGPPSQGHHVIHTSVPPATSLPRSPPDRCIGPPLINPQSPTDNAQLSLSVGSPETLQGADWAPSGLARMGGNGPAAAQTVRGDPQSDRRAVPVNRMDSTPVFPWSALTQHTTVTGPNRGSSITLTCSTGPGCLQRQDSSASNASSSSMRSVRSSSSSSSSGQTTHTCLSSKAGCGAVVICSDASPPPPPSPFSPSSSTRSSLPASSPTAAPESPHSPPQLRGICLSHSPAASYNAAATLSHVSPGAYPFPPTPESDSQSTKSDCPCQSPGGKATALECLTMAKHDPYPSGMMGEPAFFPGGGMSSVVIGYAGLPTPPHGLLVGDSVVQPPPSSSVNALPQMFSEGGLEDTGEVKEEAEGVDFEEEVSEEVVDSVCDEHGVWLMDSDGDGDKFLHSLSGMPNERVAVEYLHRLQHKPGFLQALNSHNNSMETPLYNAACLGKLALVVNMLQLGANVNIQCRYGDQAHTVLHRAVERGEATLVDMLLRADHTDLNARRSSDHCTALMVALTRHVPGHPRHDRLRIINRMVEEEDRLDLEARDPRSGKTALMMAVETKDVRVVDALVNDLHLDRARHLINMQNRAGNSAVHLAAGLHDVAVDIKEHMLRRLIQLGGDTNKKNNEGDTPKVWAPRVIDRVARLR